MRNIFAAELSRLSQSHDDVILMYGDIGNKLFDEFKEKNPGKFFNAGVAEASMVGVAAGLAKKGFRPFVYTINSFLYLKAFEQIKLDVCYANIPVVLVGTGSALSYSGLGSTHHSLEDIGALRTIPNLEIYAPSSPRDLKELIPYIYERGRPSYIRIGKKGERDLELKYASINSDDYFGPFVSEGEKTAQTLICCMGTIAENVEKAVRVFDPSRSKVSLAIFSQIAPIQRDAVRRLMSNYRKCLVIEEHCSVGGLQSVLMELSNGLPSSPKIEMINTPLDFFVGLGETESARQYLGLSVEALVRKFNESL